MRYATQTRSLLVFLAGSAVAHAAVLGVLPGFPRGVDQPPRELEVRLQQPVPLPVAPPEREAPPPPKSKMQPRPAPVATGHPEHNRPAAPVLALPAAEAPAASAFTVPAPEAAQPAPSSDQRQQVASVAVTPPAFGAAYLRNPPPLYPAAAKRNGVEGTVTLRVAVTRDGLPARVELEKSSGSMHLDHAALEAVKAWRFVPARRGSEPVEGVVTFPMVFRLENSS